MNDQHLSIYFATVTGNSEICAHTLASMLAVRGVVINIGNLAKSNTDAIRSAGTAVFSVSTWGDGEPPDDAIDIWSEISALPDGYFSGLRYAIVALGDSSYDIFCGFGIDLDKALARLGAVRLVDSLLCDGDWEDSLRAWVPVLLEKVSVGETCQ